MNHFLKPIGHCLTTAVMTSAMLRIYALPVEAAPLPDTSIDTQTTSAASGAASETAVSATDLVPTQIAPPEVIAPVPTVVAPAIVPAEPIPASPVHSAQATSVSPVKPASETVNAPEKAAEEPETAETPAGAFGSSALEKPSASGSTPLVPIEPKATTASPQKAAEPNTRTIAGMRQVIEKRLATIVDRDKASRTAQWQQMLIQTALQYAWTHQFSQARQVAQHPALPIELQTDLLGKIAVIELQSSSIAQPLPKLNPSGAVAQPGTVAAGQIPSSYLAGAGLPSYAGITLGNQCPAIGSVPMAKAVKSSSPAAKPARVKKGIPTFVPSLSQNLANRLVQLSQAAEAEQNLQASSAKTAQQPLVIPQLFIGVAQQTVATTAAQASPLVAAPNSVGTAQSQLTETSAAVSTVAAVSTIAARTPAVSAPVPRLEPMRAAAIETTEAMTSVPSTGSIPLTGSVPSTRTIPELASVPVSSTLEQLLNSTFYSFQQVGIPFAQLVSEPFNFDWWHDAPEPTAPTQPDLKPNSVAIGAALPELQPALPQTPQWRDARKLAIPSLPKLPVPSKAVKVQTQDISALLATSCANAQLGHYELGDYVVHPTTAKQQGWGNLMFPLPISAAITSAFGWRIHPISGSLSFHAGIDIGAPMGTPVMAAQSGKVVAADYMGGYGLAVVIENDQNRQRNLYGHLSGVAVQPGVQIAEGAILGWVGSTGNSTGPHLHLEAQVRTEAGWTAIDPLAAAALTLAKGE